MYLQAINEVKVTYQGQGHTSSSNQGQHQIEVIFKEIYSYAGGLHFEIKCVLVLYLFKLDLRYFVMVLSLNHLLLYIT